MAEWRYSSTIFDLGTTWRWVVRFTPRQFYPRYPLVRTLGGSHRRSGRCEEKKLATAGDRTAAVQPVATARYPGYRQHVKLNNGTVKQNTLHCYAWHKMGTTQPDFAVFKWMKIYTDGFQCCGTVSVATAVLKQPVTSIFTVKVRIFNPKNFNAHKRRLHIQYTSNWTIRELKSTIFWDITPCSPLKDNRRFGGTFHLHGTIRRARYQRESR
jgi:hypothetical protein